MRQKSLILNIFIVAILLQAVSFPAWAENFSNGYQMALLDARALNPQKILLQQKITPDDSAVREFDWIIETLRNRCHNSQSEIVMTLVESWRALQRSGNKVTLQQFSRQVADFSTIASQAMRNKKLEIIKLANKVIKDKYTPKQ